MYNTFHTDKRKLLLFESIFNLTSDGMVVVDLEGRVLEINKKFEELHGWTREEVIGKVLPMTPDDLKEDAFQLYERIIKGEPYSGIEGAVKLRKDGSFFYADVTVSPVHDEDGRIVAFIGVERDITEKRLAEQALKQSEERYRTLVQNSPEPIILVSKGLIRLVNDRGIQLFGASSLEDLIGRSFLDLVCQDHQTLLREWLDKVVQTDEHLGSLEIGIQRLNRAHVDVELSSICVHMDAGAPVLQIVIRDMTERKRMEEMILKSEKLSVIGQLAAGIAHEIRNPLTSLKGFAQLLKSQNTNYMDVMLEELDRIEYIVNEFMTLAKPQMVRHKETRIQSLIRSVIQFMQPQALLVNVQFHLTIDDAAGLVSCDANQIKQVLMNILKNAMESMPDGGNIDVVVLGTPDQGVLIRVADHGTGIPEDKLPKLGEPFFSMKDNGTGLGLMICQSIIEAHRGTMSIQSKVNQGTTVSIELPHLRGKTEQGA